MNKNFKWTRGLCLLLLPLAVACKSEDSPEPKPLDPDVLPEDTYPVEYSALVNHFSTDDAAKFEFSTNDRLSVQSVVPGADGIADWTAAHTGLYQIGTDGKLTATTGSAYWTRKDEVRQVRGWYAAGASSSELPSQWSVPVDQAAGHRDGVLLYGTGNAAYGSIHSLQLHHQTAMVKINVKFEGTASKHYSVTGVTLGNNDLAAAGSFTAPADGEKYGTWTVSEYNATVVPQTLSTPEGYSASVQAVVIPQTVGGKKLVNVAISNGSTLSWTPDEGEVLKAGVTTLYDVKVSADLTTLVVTKIEGTAWGEGVNENTTSWLDQPDYGEVKIGDYYYSDGSWSDGGFIGFDDAVHGSVKWATPKPAPVNVNPITGKERQVIGVVFSVDNSRIGEAEKKALLDKRIKPHGLVLYAGIIQSTQWDAYSNDESAIGIPNIKGDENTSLYLKANNDISGYKVCTTILERRTGDISTLDNYKAITDTRALYAPATSTGWFIATGGQWFDMLRNFTGMDMSDKAPFYFESNQVEVNDYVHFDWQIDMNRVMQAEYKEDFVELLNYPFSTLPADGYTPFEKGDNIITATLADAGNMYYTVVFPKYITFRRVAKNYWIKARPILAF